MTPRSVLEILAELSPEQRHQTWHWYRTHPLHAVPNIYRVRNDTRWQCEWDDLTEVGAFRSRSLSSAVRKANRARRRRIVQELASS